MRLTLCLQIALVFGGLLLLDRRFAGVALAAALGLTNPYAFKAVVGGMESALQLLLLAVVLARAERWRAGGAAIRTGLLLGLLALARIEALAFGAAYLALVGRGDRPFAIRALAAFLVPVGLWTAFAFATFGTPIPVSGVHLSGAPRLGLRTTVGILWLAFAFGLGRRLHRYPAVAALAFYVGAQMAFVVLFQGRVIPMLWYLAPALLLVALAAAGLARRLPLRRLMVPAFVLLWGAGAAFAWVHRVEPASYSSYAAARRDGRWLATRLGDDQHAAGWDVGIVAAHAGGRVANLEGLVAAPDFDPNEAPAFLNAHPDVRYLVQFIRQHHLCGQVPLRYAGVMLETLPVARHEAVDFSAADPRMSTTIHRMIFDLRGDAATDVPRIRARACGD